MKKRYILLKEDSTWKKGAIVEEECEDGSQDFILISKHEKFPDLDGEKSYISRNAVIKNPTWFKEIKEVLWLTKDQVKQVKKLFKIK